MVDKPKIEGKQDFSKYQKITDGFVKDLFTYPVGLEDAVTFAWADHVRKSKDSQGKDLGSAVYDAARDYVMKEFYGIKDDKDLSGNDNLKAQIERIIQGTIGYKRSQLSDHYRDEKAVHREDLAQIIEPMKENISKNIQTIHMAKMDDLEDNDFGPFRSYVLNLAEQVGVKTLKADDIPTLSAAKREYASLLRLYIERKAAERKAERYKPQKED